MNRVFPIFVILVAACALPSAALAQPAADTGTVFVGLSGFADMRRARPAKYRTVPMTTPAARRLAAPSPSAST